MSERKKFMASIKSMWVSLGRSEYSWNAAHDWDELFRIGGRRADGAAWAFEEALRCE